MISSPSELEFTTSADPTDIRASTVLPARRSNCSFTTEDGLELVGEIALPEGELKGLIVSLHPLPTHGGFMDSHVFRKASYRLPALAGIGILRFNTRGTSSPRGQSDGMFDGGASERFDVAAAVDFSKQFECANTWLLGWSFGTELALKYGTEEPAASATKGAILLSPPLKRANDEDLQRWAETDKPLIAVVPEFDDYLRPAEAAERFGLVPQAEVIPVAGAKHLWVGEKYVKTVLDIIASTVLGEKVALPDTWAGPSANVSG